MILPTDVAGWHAAESDKFAFENAWRLNWSSYSDRQGRRIDVVVYLGNARHVAILEPFGICEPQWSEQPEKFETKINAETAETWRAMYRTGVPPEHGYALWAHELNGRWIAPDWPKLAFANSRHAIKCYVLLRNADRTEEAQAIATEFATALLAAIQIER